MSPNDFKQFFDKLKTIGDEIDSQMADINKSDQDIKEELLLSNYQDNSNNFYKQTINEF